MGTSISYKFLVSHMQPGVGKTDKSDADEKDIDKWLQTQVEEAMSWGGYISALLYGGISTQIEHHINPALDPTFHILFQQELRKICRSRGIRYAYQPTLFHAVWHFHRELWTMGSSLSSATPDLNSRFLQ